MPVKNKKRTTNRFGGSLKPVHIAFFISPHGFGHAARAAAVMESLQMISPVIHFSIFTRVPKWFFEDTVYNDFYYQEILTDIGMVQINPFLEDLNETLHRLRSFYPLNRDLIAMMVRQVVSCDMILCDIAPLGLAVAREAKIPSVLLENFTWDWIYEGCLEGNPALAPHITYLKSLGQAADYHIQAQPVCASDPLADLVVNPISRKPRQCAIDIRRRLGIPDNRRVVLITTGGSEYRDLPWRSLFSSPDVTFLVPGPFEKICYRDNVIGLPMKSNLYHPDLIAASDAVIGKVGYSTVSEVYHSGVPFGYIPHSSQRESETLEKFIVEFMPAVRIDDQAFQEGNWLPEVEGLLKLAPISRNETNGADQVARWLLDRLGDPGRSVAGHA